MRVLIFSLFFTANSFAQVTEFQGEIKYLHLFSFKQPDIDTFQILKDFGSSSSYIYRDGSYKWEFKTCSMEKEYYSGFSGDTYDKYADNDTLILLPDSPDDTLLRYEIFENADTICGYVCNRIKVAVGNKSDKKSILIRNISYSTKLPVDPENFKKINVFCLYDIYKITKSVPLRIELIVPYWPFTMCYYATEVKPRKVDRSETDIPKNSLIKH